jgi:hypothetical protein
MLLFLIECQHIFIFKKYNGTISIIFFLFLPKRKNSYFVFIPLNVNKNFLSSMLLFLVKCQQKESLVIYVAAKLIFIRAILRTIFKIQIIFILLWKWTSLHF